MNTFFIQTLGCKVNQYESDGIASGLEAAGWRKIREKHRADVIIINTCAVTARAGMQSRQAVRGARRQNSSARVIVTGCHAQTEPELIRAIEGVDQVVCHKDKTRIADYIASGCDDKIPLNFRNIDHVPGHTFDGFAHTVQGDMTRAYLKIQDGCNAFCSYCIVPHARGPSVSMHPGQVFRQLKELDRAGFKEVILTGIHLGMYGLDLKTPTCLSDLLKEMDQTRPVHRIRLSSIEPGEITEDIVRLADPGHILCDHFHIPLQSGDNRILEKMKRPYDTVFFRDMVWMIHEILPSAAIGVDTLIGFPTETDQEFENTYSLIEALPVSYLHVFPFSPRKGTPAFHLAPKVNQTVIKQRCARMMMLGLSKKKAFIETNLHRRLEGLVQHQTDKATGCFKAVTANYLSVFFRNESDVRGKIVDLIPEQCDSNLTIFGHIDTRSPTKGVADHARCL